MDISTVSNPQSGLSLNLSPETSPGSNKHHGRASAELSYRSTSALQGSEMYRTKIQARQAQIQAQILKNRIDALRKKEEEAQKVIMKTAIEEEFKLHMLEEKLERERMKRLWKEEQAARTQSLKTKLQTERQNSVRRKKEAISNITEQRRFIVTEAKISRRERDSTIRQMQEKERETKRMLKEEIKQREVEAIGRSKELQETTLITVKESYAQQMEAQRKLHLDAMQEAEALQKKAEEALKQYKTIEEEKEKVVVRRRRMTPSPQSAG